MLHSGSGTQKRSVCKLWVLRRSQWQPDRCVRNSAVPTFSAPAAEAPFCACPPAVRAASSSRHTASSVSVRSAARAAAGGADDVKPAVSGGCAARQLSTTLQGQGIRREQHAEACVLSVDPGVDR